MHHAREKGRSQARMILVDRPGLRTSLLGHRTTSRGFDPMHSGLDPSRIGLDPRRALEILKKTGIRTLEAPLVTNRSS